LQSSLGRIIFFVGLMAVFLGIGIASWRTRPSSNLLTIQVGASRGIILPAQSLDHELHPCSRSVPQGAAIPNPIVPAQLISLEHLLPAYVADNPPQGRPAILARLPTYNRRYSGLLREGRPAIYVSLVDSASYETRGWRQASWGMCDGGTKAFAVEFDLQDQRFTHIAYDSSLAR
jgi:hypothetical protein